MTGMFLLEGNGGRGIHLYNNGDLTFSKLKEIFIAASDGKLDGVEKVGSLSLLISFSVKDGRAKCAKTKGEIKAGGVSIENFASKLDPEKKDTFLSSAKLFEKTIQSLSHDEQAKLFGKETNIFYNCSLISGSLEEVMNYDTKTLVIDATGHLVYDREKNEFSEQTPQDNLTSLQKIINDSQDQLKQDNYSVQANAIKRLKALSDKKPLNMALSKINSLLSTVNTLIKNDSLQLSESSTISEFMIARVYVLINAILKNGKIENFDPIVKMNIAKWILGVQGISVVDMSSKVSKEKLAFVKENLLNSTSKNEILKTAVLPLETIVNDFAIEMLRGLQSAFILDNEKEANRIKDELKKAIDTLQASDNEEILTTLKQQMSKIRSLEKVGTTVDGFVFDYDGTTYKFGGNFAPISKILNIFKSLRKPDQEKTSTISENYIYDIIIEEINKKGTKYFLVSKKKHVKKENMGAGAVAGAVGAFKMKKEEK